jgi:hypothetical protein
MIFWDDTCILELVMRIFNRQVPGTVRCCGLSSYWFSDVTWLSLEAFRAGWAFRSWYSS